MTVQDLINELSKIEDKTKVMIWVHDYECTEYDNEIDGLTETKRHVSINGKPDNYWFEKD